MQYIKSKYRSKNVNDYLYGCVKQGRILINGNSRYSSNSKQSVNRNFLVERENYCLLNKLLKISQRKQSNKISLLSNSFELNPSTILNQKFINSTPLRIRKPNFDGNYGNNCNFENNLINKMKERYENREQDLIGNKKSDKKIINSKSKVVDNKIQYENLRIMKMLLIK